MTVPDALRPVLVSLRASADFGHRESELAGWRYSSFAALLLAEGRLFDPVPLEFAADLVPAAWRGEPGSCYVSAALWSMAAGLPYVEGLAAAVDDPASFLGTEHAWCGDSVGRALDPTWRPGWGVVYLGLPVTAEYRRAVHHPRLLTGEHAAGRALLRDGVPDSARVEVGRPVPAVPALVDEFGFSWAPATGATDAR